MTYEFGDYKVKTKHDSGGLLSWGWADWIAYIYYKDNWFETIKFNNTETMALRNARYSITNHKLALKALADV